MVLSKRLTSIAKLVDHNDIIADIGCDHALLDIYLIKNNIVSKALACDINPNALNNGINNIKKHHLEAQIKTKLACGINSIPKDINTLIISGMGTNTICEILSNKKINQIDKLIIESNNNHYELRKYITNLGYIIIHEEAIFDNDKYYINIVFKRGKKKYQEKELKYGPILMKKNSGYYEYLINQNNNILNKIPLNNKKERNILIKENNILKKLIENDSN